MDADTQRQATSADSAALLLGGSYRPGGIRVVRRLVELMDLEPGMRVLEVASGSGATSLRIAEEFGLRVHGIENSAADVRLAMGAAVSARIGGQVTYAVGESRRLPCPDRVFDAAFCDCAFPGDVTAMSELWRVLDRDGRLGISGFVADADAAAASPELATLARWIPPVTAAMPLVAYRRRLSDGGFTVTHEEMDEEPVTRLVDQLEARIELVRRTAHAQASRLGVDVDRAHDVIAAARTAAADGMLNFVLIVAERVG